MQFEQTKHTVLLTGLLGTGKSRLYNELESLSLRQSLLEWQNPLDIEALIEFKQSHLDSVVYCVVDTRTPPAHYPDWLLEWQQALLQLSDGVIFNFIDQVGIDTQTAWSKWVTTHLLPSQKPNIKRWPAPNSAQSLLENLSIQKRRKVLLEPSLTTFLAQSKQALPNLEVFHFKVGKINLEHLLMGLDNSKQALQMKVLRVFGVLQTDQYAPLITLEGSAVAWHQHLDSEQESANSAHTLTIWGLDLDRTWLNELIDVAQL